MVIRFKILVRHVSPFLYQTTQPLRHRMVITSATLMSPYMTRAVPRAVLALCACLHLVLVVGGDSRARTGALSDDDFQVCRSSGGDDLLLHFLQLGKAGHLPFARLRPVAHCSVR